MRASHNAANIDAIDRNPARKKRDRNAKTIGSTISPGMKCIGAFASRPIDVAKPGSWPGWAGRVQCGSRAMATAKPHAAEATRSSTLLVFGEDQRRIRPAEAERVREHVADVFRAGLIRHVVEIAVGSGRPGV